MSYLYFTGVTLDPSPTAGGVCNHSSGFRYFVLTGSPVLALDPILAVRIDLALSLP